VRHWSLKVKFGAYAASLVLIALAVAAVVMLPTFYYSQLRQVDRQLAADAEELFRDLENFRGAPVNPRRPLSARFIPVGLQDRLLVLKGPEGQPLYVSPGLNGDDLAGFEAGYSNFSFEDRPYRIGVFDREPFFLQVGAPMSPARALQRSFLRGLALAMPITALLVFGGGFWLAKYAIRPVSALTASAERISVNRLDEKLPMPVARDEIARLTEVLNDAFERLKQSYETATRFSADASHQLKTPIAVLRLGLEELRACETLTDGPKREVDTLLHQTRRLTTLINELLLLAQADAGRLVLEPEETDINPMIQAATDDVETLTHDRGVTVETQVPPTLVICVDQRRVRMALQIITENAAKYTPDSGRIRLDASIRDGMFRLNLANTGNPILELDRDRIFERFHRGADVGEEVQGHGLGLNIARTLLRAHRGDLRLVRSDAEWTVFQMSLPIDGSIEA
jgi:signal transduction histidine kinase